MVNVPGLSKPFVLDPSGWAGSVLCHHLSRLLFYLFLFCFVFCFFGIGRRLALTQLFINKVCDQSWMQYFWI